MLNVKEVTSSPPISHSESKATQTRVDEWPNSSVEKSGKLPEFEPSKPVLDRPSPLWDVLAKMQRIESASDDYSIMKERDIERGIKELERLHADETLAMDKAIAAQKDVTFWTVLQDIGNIIMGGVTAVLGVFTFAYGNPVLGGVLIAAGVASIANIAFKYGKVWDWMAERLTTDHDMREAFKTYVPAAISVVCAVVSLVATAQIWKLPNLATTQRFLSMVQTASTLATGVANLAKGMGDAKLKWATSELKALQSMSELTKLALENATDEVQTFHKEQLESNKVIATLINEANEAIQLINQPV